MHTRLALLIAGAFCASILVAPAMAADQPPAAKSAEKHAAGEAKAAAKNKRTVLRERRMECEKNAEGMTGVERKKFLHECIHSTGPVKPVAKPAVARPAAPVRPAVAAPAAVAGAPATAPAAGESHKDAYPAARLNENPRLRARSCIMDADEKGLTGPERQSFLRGCAK